MTLSFEKRDKLIYISNKVMRKKALSICILSIIFSSTAYSQQDRERVTVPTKLQDYREKEISELATHQLNRRYSPLSDSQSKELKERNEDRERMINESVREPAPQSRTILINPKMVDKDNVIYASANYQTTIVFVDRFGKPWDITNKGIGAEPFFDISQYEPHSITVNPLRKYVKTNLTIMLKGATVPMVFTLKEDRDVVDYIAQVKVNDIGPESSSRQFSLSPLEDSIRVSSKRNNPDELLMSDGITPDDARLLKVSKDGYDLHDFTVWEMGQHYYVRTKGELLSPFGEPVAKGIDGVTLFKTSRINSLMVEIDGVLITGIKIKKIKGV